VSSYPRFLVPSCPSSHDMLPMFPADILYISVCLLAPCKSIFALPLESNLSVSVGSKPPQTKQGNAFEYETGSPSYRVLLSVTRICSFMKSVSKYYYLEGKKINMSNDHVCSHIVSSTDLKTMLSS